MCQILVPRFSTVGRPVSPLGGSGLIVTVPTQGWQGTPLSQLEQLTQHGQHTLTFVSSTIYDK